MQGQVFVELLGPTQGGNSSQYLGFEIVQIYDRRFQTV
jgi:hypothetical protein